MIIPVTILVLLLVCTKGEDPEADMSVEEVIEYHGFPVETYDVITSDDYILTLHRIPHGKEDADTSVKRPVVILMHGIMLGSNAWIADIPEKNLPYLLAEQGSDVFLPNLRGNFLSRRHQTLSPDSNEFWDVCLDDMADFDLPAIFERVLNVSGAEKFTYIGFSMGTTVMFMFLTNNPDYEKVTSFHALAPITTVTNSRSPPMQIFIHSQRPLYTLLKYLERHEFLSSTTTSYTRVICRGLRSRLCLNLAFTLFGFDAPQFNNSRMPVYVNFAPVGVATKTIHQYLQSAHDDRFQKYDYGREKNLELYKQATPPEYDVSQIRKPIYFYSGLGDWMADPTDVNILKKKLKTLQEHFTVSYRRFNHVDFLWALKVVQFLYEKLLENVKKTWS